MPWQGYAFQMCSCISQYFNNIPRHAYGKLLWIWKLGIWNIFYFVTRNMVLLQMPKLFFFFFLVRKGKHLLEGLDKFKRHIVEGRISIHINNRGFDLSIYLYGLVTAVAVFRNPNTIPFCLATDLLLNILFSWLLVLLPSTFFLDVLFFLFPLVFTP